MGYSVDEWVWYIALPDLDGYKDDRKRAVILAALPYDPFYDYRIFVDGAEYANGHGRVLKVRKRNLNKLIRGKTKLI